MEIMRRLKPVDLSWPETITLYAMIGLAAVVLVVNIRYCFP